MAVHGRGQPARAVISRGSLADPPDLLKRGPFVISGARDRLAFAVTAGQGQPGPAVICRSSVADVSPPAAATPAPLVITPAQGPAAAAAAIVTRGAVQDPADFKGRQPVVTVPQPPSPAPVPPVTVRNTLADPPVLTTPAPQVIPAAATPGHGRPGPAIIAAAPFIPVAAPTQATPAPLVAWTQPPAVPPQQALTSRNSLADAPVLTTPAPVVVMATAVTPHGRPQAAVITGSPAAPAAAPAVTPRPVVVAQAVKLAAAQPPVILRNTLADPPVLTTPRPVLVMTQVRPPPTTTVISAAPFITPPPPVVFGSAVAAVGTMPRALDGTGTAPRALDGTGPAASTPSAVSGDGTAPRAQDAQQQAARAQQGTYP